MIDIVLTNRKTAWVIAVCMIISGLFLGTYTTFYQMRRQVVRQFRVEAEPVLNEMIQMTYNMLTIYLLNAPDDEDNTAWMLENIEQQSRRIAYLEFDAGTNEVMYNIALRLTELSEPLELSESDARFMRNFLIDIDELNMVLRQTDYNTSAAEFNTVIRQGLGFLVPFIRPVPVF